MEKGSNQLPQHSIIPRFPKAAPFLMGAGIEVLPVTKSVLDKGDIRFYFSLNTLNLNTCSQRTYLEYLLISILI